MFSVLFPTVIQMATHNRIRAQISAVHLMVVNLVGIGFGPTTIALVTDNLFKNDLAVGDSIALVGTVACLISASTLFLALKPFKRRVISVLGPMEKNFSLQKPLSLKASERLASISATANRNTSV